MRCSSASRKCPHQHELEKEAQEDQRIFGKVYLIQDILALKY